MFKSGKFSTKLFIACLLVVIFLLLVFILYSNYFKRSSFFINLLTKQKLSPIVPKVDETQLKKVSLTKFYKELSLADNKPDYEKLYEIIKPSLGIWISKEEFISYEKALDAERKTASSEAIIHSIKVEGNNGFVDRTVIHCYSKECIGKDREENRKVREYAYIDGKWSVKPDKEPSERSLKASTYMITNGIKSDVDYFLKKYSIGTNKKPVTIHFMAVDLDNDLQELLTLETYIETAKIEASRPVVNYEAPAINYQPPNINVNVPRQNNSANCTSNTIGNYTYTNCF